LVAVLAGIGYLVFS